MTLARNNNNSEQRYAFFLSLKFFKLLPQNIRQLLCEQLQPIHVTEGDSVIRQGDQGDALYFIEQGTCTVVVEKENGIRHQIAIRGAGEMVGEMALITDEPRQAHVIAASDLQLWKLGRDNFVELVQKQHDLQEFLTELVAVRLENAAHTADRTIGKYRIEFKLGHGAWAIVYQGRHVALGKKIVIKMLKHQMAMIPEFHERFFKEAKIIATMQHKNIINVFDIEERFNTIFIVMEYLEGTPLDVLLEKEGPLSADMVVSIIQQVCAGLSYAHEQGIVHQDIKPANLFLLSGGQIKILDFGLACPFGSENIEMEGTIQYMSPEQIESYPVDARTDIYCLGITAFELLTGSQPYPDVDIGQLMEMHLNTDISDPADLIADVPPQLSACIRKCCNRNHKERYQSASEVSQALNELIDSMDKAQSSMKQNMSSLYLFYNDEQKAVINSLLEEFSQRATAEGVHFQLAEFDNFLS